MKELNDLYLERNSTNYRVPLVKIHVKVGTNSSSVWLIRKKNLRKVKVGASINIYSERWAQATSVIVRERRAGLWFVDRF